MSGSKEQSDCSQWTRTYLDDTVARAQKRAQQRQKQRQHRLHRQRDHECLDALQNHQGTPPAQGQHAEQQAAYFLQNNGLHVLARNLRCKAGEIDLVAQDHGTLVFVEVRARSSTSYGGAAASIGWHKQRRLVRAAQFFLPSLRRRYFCGQLPICRFDVICFEQGQLRWIKQAFQA